MEIIFVKKFRKRISSFPLWLLVSFYLSSVSNYSLAGDLPRSVQNSKCFKKLSPYFKEINHKEWTKVLSLQGQEAYKTPTRKVGKWLQVISSEKGDIYLQRLSSQWIKIEHFDKKCRHKSSKKPNKQMTRFKNTVKKSPFTDKDLLKLLNKKQAIIYVWSPQFVYSWKFREEVKTTARLLKIPFISIMAASSDRRWLSSRDARMPKTDKINASLELIMRGSERHLPKTFVVKSGAILPNSYTGVFPKEVLYSDLKRILK